MCCNHWKSSGKHQCNNQQMRLYGRRILTFSCSGTGVLFGAMTVGPLQLRILQPVEKAEGTAFIIFRSQDCQPENRAKLQVVNVIFELIWVWRAEMLKPS